MFFIPCGRPSALLLEKSHADPALGGALLQVVGHISYVRGSRTLTETRPVKAGASPGAVTDEELLAFLLDALRPWLER